ncbi:hypothetical protein [Nocardiopsis tropica]|uniref:Transposase n=1 Tax=Nocardiopsis tropica TaxID=109330 RepID=A0ABU7KKL1_9ACTN|nr:hypothetical protein [Nocardiopsis umidischolae]MEE2049833.1 hypothetical protein [Nocardiopsis umidischolae]
MHWMRAKTARRSGLSKSTIGRIRKAFNLRPHRTEGFKLSNDPLFVDKAVDVVWLYPNPPENTVVYGVDEKSQVQALGRSKPALPMMPGMPDKRSPAYVRHGTTTLFTALNIQDGSVIGKAHRSHRATGFKKLLALMDEQVPEHLQVHVVCDIHSTHWAVSSSSDGLDAVEDRGSNPVSPTSRRSDLARA